MKKSLIAGAGIAALGLAVVPFAGVFAATTDVTDMTDKLTVNVDPTCTFSEYTDGDTPYAHTKTATMSPDKLATVGTTNMKIVCNNVEGYEVKGVFTNLVNNIPTNGTKDSITYKAGAVAAGDGAWSATVTPVINGTTQAAVNPANGSVIFESSTTTKTTTGDTAAITYNVGTRDNQAEGIYKGTGEFNTAAGARSDVKDGAAEYILTPKQ